jgi:hypothetical protein
MNKPNIQPASATTYGWREALGTMGTSLIEINARLDKIPYHLSVFGLSFTEPPNFQKLAEGMNVNPGNSSFLDQVRLFADYTSAVKTWCNELVIELAALTDNVNANGEHEKSILQAKQGGHEPPVRGY